MTKLKDEVLSRIQEKAIEYGMEYSADIRYLMERPDNTLRVILDSIVEVMEDLVTRVKVHELPDNCIVHIESSVYLSQEQANRLIAPLAKAYNGKGIEFVIAKKGDLSLHVASGKGGNHGKIS